MPNTSLVFLHSCQTFWEKIANLDQKLANKGCLPKEIIDQNFGTFYIDKKWRQSKAYFVEFGAIKKSRNGSFSSSKFLPKFRPIWSPCNQQ
jgi:hypothetical protein